MALGAIELLRECTVAVSTDTFALVSISEGDWPRVISDPDRSPRMTAPFMIFKDAYEITLVLDEIDLANMRPALGSARIETGFRMLTFETEMDFNVVGFIAIVAGILAESNISIIPVSSFSRDHLLVKQGDLARALKALGPHVGDLC